MVGIAEYFNVYYKAHVQDIGWTNWVSNGDLAGTVGMEKRLEAIAIRVLPKGINP